MVRRWVAVAAVAVVVVLAGCSSDGGSSASSDFKLPDLTGKDWTPAGLATAKATTDAIAQALPGQCADAAVTNFADLAFGMEQVRTKIIPTGQMTCDVNDEVVEITVFAEPSAIATASWTTAPPGLCRIAAAQQKKYKARATFPGIRWVVGAGNVTLQPDSESLARRLGVITGGTYVPTPCDNGVHADWDADAITALDALGARIGAAARVRVRRPRRPRDPAEHPGVHGRAAARWRWRHCAFDGTQVELISHLRTTPQVTSFLTDRVKTACAADPAVGRIDGDGFTVLAPGTIAEQVHAVTGGTLAPSSCGG